MDFNIRKVYAVDFWVYRRLQDNQIYPIFLVKLSP